MGGKSKGGSDQRRVGALVEFSVPTQWSQDDLGHCWSTRRQRKRQRPPRRGAPGGRWWMSPLFFFRGPWINTPTSLGCDITSRGRRGWCVPRKAGRFCFLHAEETDGGLLQVVHKAQGAPGLNDEASGCVQWQPWRGMGHPLCVPMVFGILFFAMLACYLSFRNMTWFLDCMQQGHCFFFFQFPSKNLNLTVICKLLFVNSYL